MLPPPWINYKHGESFLCTVCKRISQSLILLLILQTLLEMMGPQNSVCQRVTQAHFSSSSSFLYRDSGSQIWSYFRITWKFHLKILQILITGSYSQRYWLFYPTCDFLLETSEGQPNGDFCRRASVQGSSDVTQEWTPGRRQSQRTVM